MLNFSFLYNRTLIDFVEQGRKIKTNSKGEMKNLNDVLKEMGLDNFKHLRNEELDNCIRKHLKYSNGLFGKFFFDWSNDTHFNSLLSGWCNLFGKRMAQIATGEKLL